MKTSSTFRLRRSLRRMKFLLKDSPLTLERRGQELIGRMGAWKMRQCVKFYPADSQTVPMAFAEPEELRCGGAILYLHGGGYCCGGPEYAGSFGAVLAQETGAKVLCPAYRLAPEHRFPAAVEDALEAYRLLLDTFSPEKIAVTGESAGGGLSYALCSAAKEHGLPLPGGIAVISPWTDLTLSGASMETLRDTDPALSPERLQLFARSYTDTPVHPLASPLFGDLSGLPESRIFVGSDEILLDDALRLHAALLSAGSASRITVHEDLWHGYLLYGLEEAKADMDDYCKFLSEVTK